MFDWITHNKGLFLNSYTEIGTSHPHAMELQTQHNHFAMNCMVRTGLPAQTAQMCWLLFCVKVEFVRTLTDHSFFTSSANLCLSSEVIRHDGRK